MKKFTLFALLAGGSSARKRHQRRALSGFRQQPWPPLSRHYGPRYRDYDGPRYRSRKRYGDRGDRGGYIGPTLHDLGRSTAARTARPTRRALEPYRGY